jgi:hypothetical protein
MAYSSDGVTWTSLTNNPFNTKQYYNGVGIYQIVYGNNKFFAWGDHDLLSTSTDGVTWTELTEFNMPYGGIPMSGISIEAIAYGSGKFVIGRFKMATSTDGITWAVTDSILGNRGNGITAIVYSNGMFVVGDSSGQMATSSDGTKWTADTGWRRNGGHIRCK